MNKQKISSYINRLESFLLDHDIEVDYGGHLSNCFLPVIDRIHINTRQDLESRLYTLLHEAGHAMIRKGDFRFAFPFMRTRSLKPNGDEYRRDIKHRVEVLREEVLAWDVGEKIADELQISIDHLRWSKQRTKCLIGYAKWVNK